MTPATARSTANLLMAVAAGAVAFVVVRNPRWRRTARHTIWTALSVGVPRMLVSETRRAWAASGHGP